MSAQLLQIANNATGEASTTGEPVMIDTLGGKPLTQEAADHLKDYITQATELTTAISKYMVSTFPEPRYAVIVSA